MASSTSAPQAVNLKPELQNGLLHNFNTLVRESQSGVANLVAILESGRTVASTAEAANAFGYKQQTLRSWACFDNGPIRPVRVGGRLRWKIADIMALLEGGA